MTIRVFPREFHLEVSKKCVTHDSNGMQKIQLGFWSLGRRIHVPHLIDQLTSYLTFSREYMTQAEHIIQADLLQFKKAIKKSLHEDDFEHLLDVLRALEDSYFRLPDDQQMITPELIRDTKIGSAVVEVKRKSQSLQALATPNDTSRVGSLLAQTLEQAKLLLVKLKRIVEDGVENRTGPAVDDSNSKRKVGGHSAAQASSSSSSSSTPTSKSGSRTGSGTGSGSGSPRNRSGTKTAGTPTASGTCGKGRGSSGSSSGSTPSPVQDIVGGTMEQRQKIIELLSDALSLSLASPSSSSSSSSSSLSASSSYSSSRFPNEWENHSANDANTKAHPITSTSASTSASESGYVTASRSPAPMDASVTPGKRERTMAIATEIEACINALHPHSSNQKQYTNKARMLIFNLKKNEVCYAAAQCSVVDLKLSSFHFMPSQFMPCLVALLPCYLQCFCHEISCRCLFLFFDIMMLSHNHSYKIITSVLCIAYHALCVLNDQELQQKVLAGSVTPSALVNMAADELADAKLRAAREMSVQVHLTSMLHSIAAVTPEFVCLHVLFVQEKLDASRLDWMDVHKETIHKEIGLDPTR